MVVIEETTGSMCANPSPIWLMGYLIGLNDMFLLNNIGLGELINIFWKASVSFRPHLLFEQLDLNSEVQSLILISQLFTLLLSIVRFS